MKYYYSITILLGFLQMLMLALQTEAYCVYNNIKDKYISVYQDRENTYADRLNYFHKTVQANQRECCPRTDSACSKENDPDLRLKLHIQIQQATFGEDINDGIIVPAGGYLEVSQSEGIIYYGVYNMNGTAFPFETYSLY